MNDQLYMTLVILWTSLCLFCFCLAAFEPHECGVNGCPHAPRKGGHK